MDTILIVKVVKTAFITIVLSRMMTLGGKKEFSDMIKVGGVAIVGIHIAEYLKDWKSEHSTTVQVFGWVVKFIKWASEKKIGEQ